MTVVTIQGQFVKRGERKSFSEFLVSTENRDFGLNLFPPPDSWSWAPAALLGAVSMVTPASGVVAGGCNSDGSSVVGVATDGDDVVGCASMTTSDSDDVDP